MRTSSPGRAPSPSLKPIALAVALTLVAPHPALAAPVGHTVVAGEVTVTQPNAQTMVINQATGKAILNWRGFSIGAGETVQFVQPGSNSVALNRVTGGAPSEIFGRLEANGKVFLVNPAGVMFGKGASVDVGGLVASTLGIGDDDFLAGRYTFGDGSGSAGAVSNEGRLTAAERGTIALLGAQVSNGGTVTARLGTVGLAAGGKVTLDFNGDGLTRIVVDAARINALVENGGAIIAEGGQVTMTARAVGAIADTVVRQQGLVQATGLVERNGRILLDGGTQGKVELAGKADASGLAAGQRGGDVTLLGRDIVLAPGASIDASGDAGGGSVLVGGDYQGANPLVPHAASTTMAAGATIRADALGNGAGGKVVLWSDGLTSAHGSASATGGAQGGNGGMVETSGRTLDLAGMRVRAGAAKGSAGTWLLDPGDIYIDADLAGSISDSLNNSTSVQVRTQDADSEWPGDIYIEANIEKTAGSDVSLEFHADNDIRLGDSVRIASLGAAGKLNVDFNSDADASGDGGVLLGPDSAILSNGGDVRIYGQGDRAGGRARGSENLYEGVLLEQALIDSRQGQSDAGAGGLIAIAGSGQTFSVPFEPRPESFGVRINNSSLLSSTGNITVSGIGATYSLDGQAPARDATGVAISLAGGSRIATTSGALDLSGVAGNVGAQPFAAPGLAVLVGTDSSITTAGGAMRFTGTGNPGGRGIDLSTSGGLVSSGGTLSMAGTGGTRVSLSDTVLTADAGLSLAGSGGPGLDGVSLSLTDATIRAASTEITGTGGSSGDGIRLSMEGAGIDSSAGEVAFTGTGGDNGDGIRLLMEAASIDSGAAGVALTGTGGVSGDGIRLLMDTASIDSGPGRVAFTGTGGASGDGLRLVMNTASIDAGAGGLAFTGTGGASGDGIRLLMDFADIGAGAGDVALTGTGGVFGAGIRLLMDAASIDAVAGGVALTGTGGFDADGVQLGLVGSSIDAAGALEIVGTGGGTFDGAVVDLDSSSLSAAQISVTGTGGSDGSGVSSILAAASIEATNGALEIDGSGGGSRPGVHLQALAATIGATNGNVLIDGTGGDQGGSGVVISSYDEEMGTDGSVGSNGVMTSSSTLLYADRGDLTIAGINGSGGVSSAGDFSAALAGMAAGVDLTGIELRATDGNVLIAGAGIADANIVAATGVALSSVMATTSERPGNLDPGSVRIVGVSTSASPGVIFDGVTMGNELTAGDIIIGGRNAGAGPVFDYPGTSQWNNTVRTAGAVNLRPDDGNYNYAGIPATAVPISVGAGGSGFNVSFADLGIGGTPDAHVIVGSQEHTGQISYLDPAPFTGHLTLQNGGAGSQGIVLGSDINVSEQLTLSSGGAVSAAGSSIRAAALLLHGTQPEANFVLDGTGNTVGQFTVHFDQAASAGQPQYGDVSFGNNGALLLGGLRGAGFTTVGNQQVPIDGNNTVAGDLLLRTSDKLTLAQGLSSLAGNITLVTGTVLDSDGHGMTAGGTGGWRVFADTWVGEDRSGLTPSLPRPNYYNCAYGGTCGDAITGKRFIYRAQPTLTLTPDNLSRPYGAANPALTFSTAGLVNGDTLADALSGGYSTTAQQSSSRGAYPITGAFSSPVGYAIAAGLGTLNIDLAALLISIDDQFKIYGNADPLLTATISGLLPGDSAAVVSGLTLTAPTGAAATAGTHAIFGANAVAANYAISYRPGTLTVAPAPLTVQPDDKAKVYGDADPALTAGFSGLRYGDSGSVVSGLALTTATGAAATAGSHPIVASGGAAANYVLSYQAGTLVVAKAPLLVVADNKSKVYGAPDPVLTATMSGFRYADTAAAVSGVVLSAPVGAAAGAGNHPILAQGGVAANYALAYQPGVLAVDPAVLTYVADPTRQLQGAPQPIPGSVTGFVYNDTLASATTGTLQFVSLSPALAPPGQYAVEGRGLSAANYRFVQAPSNATALTTLPIALDERPTIAKDITFESSNVYAKNFGTPRLCVGAGPLGSGALGSESNDPLALEWSRVRVSPNLSSCLGLGQRNSCQDF